MRFFLPLFFLVGCGANNASDTRTTRFDVQSDTDETVNTLPEEETDSEDVVDGPGGFVGSACERDADCDYDGGVCLTDGEGFPRGTCSKECDQYCPDRDGHPVTFCVDEQEAPSPADTLGDGACFARCDYGLFPGTGCRTGYGCQLATRANETWTEQYTCLPGAGDTALSPCQQELANRVISFSPTVIADASPSSHPNLTCHVEDPVIIHSPMNGVTLKYYDGSVTSNVRMSCEGALALADTLDDVKPEGVTALRHIGTYNCRVIGGTNSLSRHAFGDAIDIYGFEFSDGSIATLVDDWEHDDSTPSAPEAAFLYEAAYRWHESRIWNIILTPDYNQGHDNHFHNDLTPGSHYIGQSGDCGGVGPVPFPAPEVDSWIERKPSGF